MFVKLFGETVVISSLPDSEAIEKGYKLAEFAEKPETEKGFHAVSAWTETEDSYVQSWTVEEDVYDDSCDFEEAVNILLGGAV